MNKGKSLKLNAMISSLNTLVSLIFPLITFPYISRVLQVENVGSINLGYSIIEYFVLIAGFGVNTFAIRTGSSIRDDRNALSEFANQMFTINIITTVISIIMLLLLLSLPTKLANYKNLILVQSLMLIFSPMALDWYYSIFEDFLYITIRNTLTKVISIICMFIFVHDINDTIVYVLITSLATSSSYIFNFIHTKRYMPLKITLHPHFDLYYKELLIFWVNAFAITVYLDIDKTMLGLLSGTKAVGLYSVATNIYVISKRMVNAATTAMVPRLSYYAKIDKAAFISLGSKVIKTVIFFAVPMITGLYILNKDVILLLSGKSYLEATPALLILAIALCFAMLSNVFVNGILLSNSQEKYVLKCTLITAGINVGLNFIFIPLFKQNGAAITTLLTEAVMFVATGICAKKIIKSFASEKTLIHALIGAVAMIIISLLLQEMFLHMAVLTRLIIKILVSSLVYFILQVIMCDEICFSFLNMIKNKISK